MIFFVLLMAVNVQAQFERKEKLYKLEPIISDTISKIYVVPDFDAVTSSVNFQFYSQPDTIYKDVVNQKIMRYTKSVMIDTAYIPISKDLSIKFFEDAINNFIESCNYIRFRLGEDVSPFWVHTNIHIDTTTLKNYVQLKNESEIYTAGAHPLYSNEYWVIDKNDGKIVDWNHLLNDRKAFEKIALKYFKKVEKLKQKDAILTWKSTDKLTDEESKKITDNHRIPTYLFDSEKFELSNNFQFTKKGIKLIYLPYEAREWARGFINVEIPKNKIKNLLNFNW